MKIWIDLTVNKVYHEVFFLGSQKKKWNTSGIWISIINGRTFYSCTTLGFSLIKAASESNPAISKKTKWLSAYSCSLHDLTLITAYSVTFLLRICFGTGAWFTAFSFSYTKDVIMSCWTQSGELEQRQH